MPSPERLPPLPRYAPDQSKGGQGKEREPSPYHQAARFDTEQSAGVAYFQAQEAIYEDEMCDLSAYRLQLNRIWNVVVIGEQPEVETTQRIEAVLSSGELITLPPEALKFLNERRAQTINEGSWVEKHHRPGRRFEL